MILQINFKKFNPKKIREKLIFHILLTKSDINLPKIIREKLLAEVSSDENKIESDYNNITDISIVDTTIFTEYCKESASNTGVEYGSVNPTECVEEKILKKFLNKINCHLFLIH